MAITEPSVDLDVTLLSGTIGTEIRGIGFWDNRSTRHVLAGDICDAHCVIQRLTLRADEPC